MTEEQQAADGQIIQSESMTGVESGQSKDKKGQIVEEQEPEIIQTKAKKNQTDNVKWSIFTEAETKVSAGKAAKKAGLKLNEWIDSRLRQAAIGELTAKTQPPAKPEDLVGDIVQQFADRMKADQAAIVQAQNDLIRQQGEQLAKLAQVVENNQPKSIKEMIFGRSRGNVAGNG